MDKMNERRCSRTVFVDELQRSDVSFSVRCDVYNLSTVVDSCVIISSQLTDITTDRAPLWMNTSDVYVISDIFIIVVS